MTTLSKGTSVLIDSQIPEFISSNDPNFNAFLKAYYQWLENSQYSANGGGVLYQTKNLLSYKDIDTTTDQFIQYFINDFLPYFPQEIVADQRKLIKVAKDFYATKGSENSLKFLFRVLYGLDSEVFLPKENILKASDGKWQIPQALRLVLSPTNTNFDVTQLNQRIGYGSQSNASCVIESASHTIDDTLGIQIVEVYVSNLNRTFAAEENLVVTGNYTGNGAPFVFSEKIIGSISNVVINPKYQGLKYNSGNTANGYPGDPVVFYGGLAATAQAQKAVAYVGNVTVGSISGVSVIAGGFGYSTFQNTMVTIVGGPSLGNGGANVVVQTANLTSNIIVANIAIEFIAPSIITFPQNSYSINLISVSGTTSQTVNLNSATFQANTTIPNFYKGYILQVVNGTGASASPNTAFITSYSNTSYIATLQSPYLGVSLDATSNVILYAFKDSGFVNTVISINNTVGTGNTTNRINLYSTGYSASPTAGAYNNSLLEYVGGTGSGGAALITAYAGSPTYLANIIPIPGTGSLTAATGTTNVQIYYANSATPIGRALSFSNVAVGSITSFNVINGGYGYQSVPTLSIDSTYETDYSIAEYLTGDVNNYIITRQHIKDLGQVANVNIISGGRNYSSVSDTITLNTAYGYGATFSFTTDGNGSITSVTVTNAGEGYQPPIYNIPVTVTSSTGSGANLIAIGLNEGDYETVSVSDIGRILDFKLVSRGFDYATTPNVSLRIVDVIVKTNIASNGTIGIGNTTTSVNLYSTGFTPSKINNFYIGKTLQILTGTGASGSPNSAVISAYNGSTGVAALATALGTAPGTTSNIAIYNANVDFSVLNMYEGDFVYQGLDPGNTSFIGYLDNFGAKYSYNGNPSLSANSGVRLYNFSGSINTSQNLVFSNSGVSFIPVSFNIYGNAQAKANAIFLNGLIQYPGYYLNTDGQPSADQYLQANTKYHNFAYVVQVEKALTEYKNTLLNILHPAGMQMLNDMVINDAKYSQVSLTNNVSTYNVLAGSVTANSYWANANLVGSGTFFAANTTPVFKNLLSYTEQFDNAAWSKSNTTITANTSATTAPDGRLTADKLIENTTNSTHFVVQNVGTISGSYTISCFLKSAERYKGYIQIYSSGGNAAAFFDLNLGTITGGVGTNTITAYPNGWYRITSTSTFTSATAAVYIVLNDNSGTASYAGSGTSGMYVWGAQLEVGSAATTYQSIPGTNTGYNDGNYFVVIAANTARQQIKTITNIFSNTVLQMESNTKFLGPGYLQTINYGTANYALSNFVTTSNANTVNLNSSVFIANTKINNYYDNSILTITGGSGYEFDLINLTSGAGNTTTHVNLNTTTFQANTTSGYYNNFYLQVVSGTGVAASPNSARITNYFGANSIAILGSALGVALDGTSNIAIYSPNTFLLTGYNASTQVANLNVASVIPVDSSTIALLSEPLVSNTFYLPNTANIYGIVQAGDGISFGLGATHTQFNANVIYVSTAGNSLTVDTPQNQLISGNSQSYYFVYPVLSACTYTIIYNGQ